MARTLGVVTTLQRRIPRLGAPSTVYETVGRGASFMAHTIRIAVEDGFSVEECHWSNGTLAVTRDRGAISPNGTERDTTGGWVITHVPTGRSLCHTHQDPEVMRLLAEHLMPVVPWNLPAKQLIADRVYARAVRTATEAFLASRQTEEG